MRQLLFAKLQHLKTQQQNGRIIAAGGRGTKDVQTMTVLSLFGTPPLDEAIPTRFWAQSN